MTAKACPVCGAKPDESEEIWHYWHCGRVEDEYGTVVAVCPRAEGILSAALARLEESEVTRKWYVAEVARLTAQRDATADGLEREREAYEAACDERDALRLELDSRGMAARAAIRAYEAKR